MKPAHLIVTDRESGLSTHTDLRTGEARPITGLLTENGSSRRGNLAKQLRSLTASSKPPPAVARSIAPATTTSTPSATVARLARIGVR